MKIDKEQIKNKITDSLYIAINEYKSAIENTKRIRNVVEPIQKTILEKHQFKASKQFERQYIDVKDYIIKKDSESFMMAEDDFKIYWTELKCEYDKIWKNLGENECPLLMAEHNENLAKSKLYDESMVLNLISIEDKEYLYYDMDSCQEYINLIIDLVDSIMLETELNSFINCYSNI